MLLTKSRCVADRNVVAEKTPLWARRRPPHNPSLVWERIWRKNENILFIYYLFIFKLMSLRSRCPFCFAVYWFQKQFFRGGPPQVVIYFLIELPVRVVLRRPVLRGPTFFLWFRIKFRIGFRPKIRIDFRPEFRSANSSRRTSQRSRWRTAWRLGRSN